MGKKKKKKLKPRKFKLDARQLWGVVGGVCALLQNRSRERTMKRIRESYQGEGDEAASLDSIQRRSDYLLECLKESSEAERNRFFNDLAEWVSSDAKVWAAFHNRVKDTLFVEMNQMMEDIHDKRTKL